MQEKILDDLVTYTYGRIIDFNNKYFPNWRNTDLVYYSNAMAGECGEICNITKKLVGGGTNNKKKSIEDIHEEIADLFIYMALLCEVSGLTPKEFFNNIIKKVTINEDRMKIKWYGL